MKSYFVHFGTAFDDLIDEADQIREAEIRLEAKLKKRKRAKRVVTSTKRGQ